MSQHVMIELRDIGDLAEYPTYERLGEEVWLALRNACMNAQGNPVRLIVSTDPVEGYRGLPHELYTVEGYRGDGTDPEGFDDAAWEDMGPRPGHVLLELPL